MPLNKKHFLILGLFLFISAVVGSMLYNKLGSLNISKPKENYWGSSKSKRANVYTTESTSSSVIAVLNKVGVPFFVHKCDKKWCQISLFNGMKGYIKPIYVSRQITGVVREKTDVYNLPEGKRILATLYPNVIVNKMHSNNGWCFINKGELRGYVRCDKLICEIDLNTISSVNTKENKNV